MNNDLMTGMSLPVPISLTIEIKSCMMINRLLYGPTKSEAGFAYRQQRGLIALGLLSQKKI